MRFICRRMVLCEKEKRTGGGGFKVSLRGVEIEKSGDVRVKV